MSLNLKELLENNNAEGFTSALFMAKDEELSKGVSVQFANVKKAFDQAIESKDPVLEKFAGELQSMLLHTAKAEKLEMDSALAQENSGVSKIWKEMLGPDGEFQMSDLKNMDFGKLIGALFKSVFNGEADKNAAAIGAERGAANKAFKGAMGRFAEAESGGVDVSKIKPLIGNEGKSIIDSAQNINSIVPNV